MSIDSDLAGMTDKTCVVCFAPLADSRMIVMMGDAAPDTRDSPPSYAAIVLFGHLACLEQLHDADPMNTFVAAAARRPSLWLNFKPEPL